MLGLKRVRGCIVCWGYANPSLALDCRAARVQADLADGFDRPCPEKKVAQVCGMLGGMQGVWLIMDTSVRED